MHRPEATRELRAEIAGIPLFWRQAEGGGSEPVVYLHGVPSSSDDFSDLLERTGGIAIDLPGFGRSGKPPDFNYSLAGYADTVTDLLDYLEIERFALCVHDWGAAGLLLAQRNPQRLARLVVVNALPLFSDYRWHRLARIWRTPVLGELAMGITTPAVARRVSRGAGAGRQPVPDAVLSQAWQHFDHGTQRAILKLYRSASPSDLGAAGVNLHTITCPSLIVWGREDPYIPESFARSYAEALGGSVELELADQASHWPWIDQPRLVDRIAAFVAGEAA